MTHEDFDEDDLTCHLILRRKWNEDGKTLGLSDVYEKIGSGRYKLDISVLIEMLEEFRKGKQG